MINSTDEAPEIRLVSLNLVYDRPAVWKVIHKLLYIPFCFHFPCIISLTGYTTHYGYGRRPSEKKKPKRRFRSWFTSFCVRRSRWDTIFVVTCVIAVSLDPLFFYIPIIDREKKCLEADKELRTVTLILRSLMDITLIVHIIYLIREAAIIAAASDQLAAQEESKMFYLFEYVEAIVDNLSWPSLLTDILALLPIPQVRKLSS